MLITERIRVRLLGEDLGEHVEHRSLRIGIGERVSFSQPQVGVTVPVDVLQPGLGEPSILQRVEDVAEFAQRCSVSQQAVRSGQQRVQHLCRLLPRRPGDLEDDRDGELLL